MKTATIKISVTIVVFLCFCIKLQAQKDFDSLLNISATKYPQEKIHLHYDRHYYKPGDTVWFKIYITEKSNPSAISKNVYADLLDDSGRVVQHKIMPVYRSGAASFFTLDTSINRKLFVRAYTSWMLNFDSSLLYLKPLVIVNPKQSEIKKEATVFSLTLFPEGGDVIEKVNCRVAFKAVDNKSMPANVRGTVTNSKNIQVASFKTVHNGMGLFSYTPLYDEKYKLNWIDPDGLLHQLDMPVTKKEGIALRIEQKNGSFTYTINRAEDAIDAFKQLTVMAQMNQQTVYYSKISLRQKTQVSASIAADSLPDGIMLITVFNASNIPVAERLVFVNNHSYYFITDLSVPKNDLKPHAKTVFEVYVGTGMLNNLSIAVTDAGLEGEIKNSESIFSDLLLTSDLKGYVYNPAYYFSSNADSIKQHLDLVLMTNGWRRYKWEDLLAGQWPVISQPADNYITLTGNVFGLSKTQLTGKSLTTIIRTGNTGGLLNTIPLNSDGSFSFSNMYFFDTAKVFYQINGDKDKRLTSTAGFTFKTFITKAPEFSDKILEQPYFNYRFDTTVFQQMAKQHALFLLGTGGNKYKQLQEVVVKAKLKASAEKLDEEYTSGFFRGGFGDVLPMEDDPLAQSSLTVLDYLRTKVAGMQIRTGIGQASVTRRGEQVSFFLNEMQSDIDLIQNTQLSDIAMIKVFDPPFIGAFGNGPGGAIAVYTKKGAGLLSSIKGLNEVTIHGYSAYKEFYMPDYAKTKPTGGDYRSTLYWNPFLIMDAKNRRVSMPVFNSSNCKKMKVVIEGINELGQLTREEKIIE